MLDKVLKHHIRLVLVVIGFGILIFVVSIFLINNRILGNIIIVGFV